MKYAILFAVSVLVTLPAHAASIDWRPVQSTTGNAEKDVADGGNVVLALNGQSQAEDSTRRARASVALDGVLFAAPRIEDFLGRLATDADVSLSLPPAATTGNPDYDEFLTHVAYVNINNPGLTSGLTGTSDADAVYPISGLTANTEYFIQVWYTDERTFLSPRTAMLSDNESSQNTVAVPRRGEFGFGSFAVGRFTADAATQDLRLGITGAPRSHLTGILVREVPEPSSFAPLIVGLFAIADRSRRRH